MVNIENPTSIIAWVRKINEGDVKYANFKRSRAVSIRSTVSGYNATLGHDRDIFVHVRFAYNFEVAVLVCESREEVERNKGTENEYKWREKIEPPYNR